MNTRHFPEAMELQGTMPIPKSRVELHVHLDGSMRYETILELLKAKNLPIPGNGSLRDLKQAILVKAPDTLDTFLHGFATFLPAVQGDLAAIQRMAFEFCEEESLNGVAYVEARFAPHRLTSPYTPEVTPKHVVEAVLQGFKEGEEKFGVKARVILSYFSHLPIPFALEVLRLCEHFRNDGVVGIDLAREEASLAKSDQGLAYRAEELLAFDEARKLGIHRTVHAGEDGPAESVRRALSDLHAERIGHGYHVIDDPQLYADCKRRGIHFEMCPASSILTGSVALDMVARRRHPVLMLAQDGANFSVNTDNPTCTNTRIEQDLQLVRNWGLSDAHIVRAAFNGARSCFLPEAEKKDLIKQLQQVYGMD